MHAPFRVFLTDFGYEHPIFHVYSVFITEQALRLLFVLHSSSSWNILLLLCACFYGQRGNRQMYGFGRRNTGALGAAIEMFTITCYTLPQWMFYLLLGVNGNHG